MQNGFRLEYISYQRIKILVPENPLLPGDRTRHFWVELSLKSLRQKEINSITLNEISITFNIFRKNIYLYKWLASKVGYYWKGFVRSYKYCSIGLHRSFHISLKQVMNKNMSKFCRYLCFQSLHTSVLWRFAFMTY